MGACESMLSDEEKYHKKYKTTSNKKRMNASQNDILKDFKSVSNREIIYFNSSMKSNKNSTYILPEKLSKRQDISKNYKISSEPKARGTYGDVYIAENRKGEKFAIKKILKKKIPCNEAIIKEAEISLKLKHKNIIKVYEIYEDCNYISYVMELGDIDLFDFMYNDKSFLIPEYLIIDILIQLFDVIDYLHNEENIIHCDLKPENFMIKFTQDKKPILKLIDFGMAVYKPKDKNKRLQGFKGTREYSAPETFEGKFNEKVDEWSLGIIMYTLLTGKDLFLGENESEIQDNIKYSEINFDIIKDEELRELNKKLLNRFVANRISVKEALHTINKIYYSRNYSELVSKDNKSQNLFVDKIKSLTNKMQLINVY